MKIVLAAGLYPPDIGGPATYAKMLENALLAQGISIHVVQYGLVRSLPKWRRHAAYAWLLWKATKNSDIVYALDPISVGFPAWIVAAVRRKKFVVRLGGDYAWEQGVQRFGLTQTLDEYTKKPAAAPLLVRGLAWLQRFVVGRADAVIVPSQYLGSIVATWGVSAQCIHVVYSALHALAPLDERDILREDFGFTGTVLVSAGRLTPWKGFKTLIDVVAIRKERGESITLVIIGDGPQMAELQAYTAAALVQDRVRFVGALTRDAMAAVISAADIFVYNTVYEGLSHQLLEVMDIGTPIITTPVGGNVELITHNVEGVLVPVNDAQAFDRAVSEIEQEAAYAQRLVAAAKVRVTYFKSDTVIERMTALFKQIVM